MRLSGVSGQCGGFRVETGEVLGSRPGPATILLGSNLGQVVYSHCLPSLLSSKKLEYKKEFSDWTDLKA